MKKKDLYRFLVHTFTDKTQLSQLRGATAKKIKAIDFVLVTSVA